MGKKLKYIFLILFSIISFMISFSMINYDKQRNDKYSFILNFYNLEDTMDSSNIQYINSHLLPLSKLSYESFDDYKDLMPLEKYLAGTDILLAGESTHGTKEFFSFKHRLFTFLVEKLGYNVFALEAGMTEADLINDYILTGKGNLKDILSNLNPAFWNNEEVLSLISWMYQYNKKSTRKVFFTGFDIQLPIKASEQILDFASNLKDTFLINRSLELSKLAVSLSRKFVKRSIRLNEIDLMIEKNKKLLTEFGIRQHIQEEQFLRKKFDLINQSLLFFRKTIVSDERSAFRDSCMAMNIKWISKERFPGSKIFVWAHNYHIADCKRRMGKYLKNNCNLKTISIALTTAEGTYTGYISNGKISNQNNLNLPPSNSIEFLLSLANKDDYLIDIREIKSGKWLSDSLFMRVIGTSAKEDQFYKTNVLNSFDMLVFIRRTTAAFIY